MERVRGMVGLPLVIRFDAGRLAILRVERGGARSDSAAFRDAISAGRSCAVPGRRHGNGGVRPEARAPALIRPRLARGSTHARHRLHRLRQDRRPPRRAPPRPRRPRPCATPPTPCSSTRTTASRRVAAATVLDRRDAGPRVTASAPTPPRRWSHCSTLIEPVLVATERTRARPTAAPRPAPRGCTRAAATRAPSRSAVSRPAGRCGCARRRRWPPGAPTTSRGHRLVGLDRAQRATAGARCARRSCWRC